MGRRGEAGGRSLTRVYDVYHKLIIIANMLYYHDVFNKARTRSTIKVNVRRTKRNENDVNGSGDSASRQEERPVIN